MYQKLQEIFLESTTVNVSINISRNDLEIKLLQSKLLLNDLDSYLHDQNTNNLDFLRRIFESTKKSKFKRLSKPQKPQLCDN